MRYLYFLIFYTLLLSCSNIRPITSFNLPIRHIHFGFHPAELIMDIGTSNWYIDSIIINDKVYNTPEHTKQCQKKGDIWNEFTAKWLRLGYYSNDKIRVMINTDLKEFHQDKEHKFCIYLKKENLKDSIVGLVEPPHEGGEWWSVESSYQINFDKSGEKRQITTENFC